MSQADPQRQEIYTDSPITQVAEILLQPPTIPEDDANRIGGLKYALDYKTISSTNLSDKDIRVVQLKLNALAFDEITMTPPTTRKIHKPLENFKILSFVAMKRSQRGFMMEKVFGKTLTQASVSTPTEEPKKKRFGWFR
ncbi:MAG: hypothetical protein ABC596_08815 [Candidatus Methanosuratincola petrocarbonis]